MIIKHFTLENYFERPTALGKSRRERKGSKRAGLSNGSSVHSWPFFTWRGSYSKLDHHSRTPFFSSRLPVLHLNASTRCTRSSRCENVSSRVCARQGRIEGDPKPGRKGNFSLTTIKISNKINVKGDWYFCDVIFPSSPLRAKIFFAICHLRCIYMMKICFDFTDISSFFFFFFF